MDRERVRLHLPEGYSEDRFDTTSHEVLLLAYHTAKSTEKRRTIRTTVTTGTYSEGRGEDNNSVSRKANIVLFPAYNNTSFRGNKFRIVEGDDKDRKHRYVTSSPERHSIVKISGDVTKIEVVLEEAPDGTALAGTVPSESDATTNDFNSTFSDGIPGTGVVVVRAEEALIVVLVLVLWVAAIALFFNRWGKIRMLEPYQPKFQQQQQQQHRQSCTMIDTNALTHRTYSKFNIHWQDHPGGQVSGQSSCVGGDGFPRPRQNSVFVGSSAFLLPAEEWTPRRAKSAFDLQSLVLAECNVQVDCGVLEDDQWKEKRDGVKTSSKVPSPESGVGGQSGDGASKVGQRRRSICRFDDLDRSSQQQREKGMSVSQMDQGESLFIPATIRSSLRDRGMSICYFDRTDVVPTRPLQRDRGASVCHFDRMDVLARPPMILRDRGTGVVCQFDRMDVLARPSTSSYLSKSLFLRERERRLSVCNFIEKDREEEEPLREPRAPTGLHVSQRYDRRRLSVSNVERKIEIVDQSTCSFSLPSPLPKENVRDNDDIVSCSILENRVNVELDNDKKVIAYCFDRPSCSKTSDVVLGYKATHV